MSLLDWKPSVTSSSSQIPVVLHKPDFCARCDTFGKAMCVRCKDAEEERRKESEEKPMTAAEIEEFFAQSLTGSSQRPR